MSTRSLNKVMLIGNLTRDPQMRYTPNNTAVCTFGLATNRSWTSADGKEKQEQVEFHNIVAWAKLADICASLLHKGDKVYVEGRIQTRKWEGEDKIERKNTEIVIENMMLVKSVSEQAAGAGTSETEKSDKSEKAPNMDPAEDFDIEDVSDDVPF